MSDDLLQLIFAAALILFGLLGGTRKKKPPLPPTRPPAPLRPAGPPVQSRRPPAPSRPAPPRPASAQPRDALLQELERLLGRPEPAETVDRAASLEMTDTAEAITLERTDVEDRRIRIETTGARWAEGLARGSESLETLEEAGESSHARFHARLQAAAPPAAAREADPAVARLRGAIIWSEILGPPVSERRS